MFGKTKDSATDIHHDTAPAPEMTPFLAAAHSAPTQETTSSISSGAFDRRQDRRSGKAGDLRSR